MVQNAIPDPPNVNLPLPTPVAAPLPVQHSSEAQESKDSKDSKQPAPKKVFTLDSLVPTVTARVHLPYLYEGFDPWEFTFRVMLSGDMQKKRDAYLALAPTKQREQDDTELLDECCDLLATDPTGFGDWPTDLSDPGTKLRNYYNQAKLRGPMQLALLKSILLSANNIFWASVTPREFFPATKDTGA